MIEYIRHRAFTWVRQRPGASDMWADLDRAIDKQRQAKFDTGYQDGLHGWNAKTDDDDYLRGFRLGCITIPMTKPDPEPDYTLCESCAL